MSYKESNPLLYKTKVIGLSEAYGMSEERMRRSEGEIYIDQRGEVVEIKINVLGEMPCDHCVYLTNSGTCSERRNGPVDRECGGGVSIGQR